MLRKILLLALTSGLAVKFYRDMMAARPVDTAPPVADELHTWEDEGGALPLHAH